MALSSKYLVASGRVPDFFSKIRDGQAPDQVTQQLLKDWGFTSSNDRGFLALLKSLGFLSPDGKPTSVYHEYRDHSRSKAVMAQALRRAYGDIFLIKEHPTDSDKNAIKGKFKSYHNVGANLADFMTRTFYALLKLSDLKAATPKQSSKVDIEVDKPETMKSESHEIGGQLSGFNTSGLHYNIQIHLPATKDTEVYNAIFKSIKEHLFGE
ncbi:MAG: DUF5343 domain-containing protein [candidate division Zixibacteria bacterium]|nr:DUF5343 domain-containing protein [candidate division Zixibacteria bacterium]